MGEAFVFLSYTLQFVFAVLAQNEPHCCIVMYENNNIM